MTNQQRQYLISYVSSQLDYWNSRQNRCKEGEEQFTYYTNMMKFLVTKMDTCKQTIRPQGPNLVFPCN